MAIRRLIYSHYETINKTEDDVEYKMYFLLPFNKTIESFREDFPSFQNFSYLNLVKLEQKEYKGIIKDFVIAQYKKSDFENKGSVPKLLNNIRVRNVNNTLIEVDENEKIRAATIEQVLELSDELDEYVTTQIKESRYVFEHAEEKNSDVLSQPIEVVNVGHGLTVIDYTCNFIFDCGGNDLYYDDVLNKIITLGNVYIVVSHYHDDHYSFLYRIIDGASKGETKEQKAYSKIRNVFFFKSAGFFTKIDLELIDKMISDKKFVYLPRTRHTIRKWTIDVPSVPRKAKFNYFSAIGTTDNWNVFGDLPWKEIESLGIDSTNLKENVVLPHHGSISQYETGLPSFYNNSEKHFIASANGRHKLPTRSTKYRLHFTNIKNTFKTTDGLKF